LEELAGMITEPFKAPRPGRDDGHHGVDLGYWSRDGQPLVGMQVQAVLAGRLAAANADRPPYGLMVIVESVYDQVPAAVRETTNAGPGESLYLLYAHLQNPAALLPGEPVGCGQVLGEVGLTGLTSGPHLHLEARWGPPGIVFPSMAFYTTDASSTEMEAYQRWRMSGEFRLFDPMFLLNQP
jgi:murein DD-endopeptidase MepM/ murein hydrolase activator NlpD